MKFKFENLQMNLIKIQPWPGHQWLATLEAEIRRIVVQDQPVTKLARPQPQLIVGDDSTCLHPSYMGV
jgi:hypothetical protein